MDFPVIKRPMPCRDLPASTAPTEIMMIAHKTALLWTSLVAAAAALGAMTPHAAHADVTIEEQSTFDLSILKAHGDATEFTSADKQRRDSAFHCEGFMSLLCGNAQSGEIIRLDRDVRWSLE